MFFLFYDTFSVRAHALQNLQIWWPLQWTCMFLHFRKTWWFSWSFSIPVSALIFDEFGHRYRVHLDTLLHLLFMCFRDLFLNMFSDAFLKEFVPNCLPQNAVGDTLFLNLFDVVRSLFSDIDFYCILEAFRIIWVPFLVTCSLSWAPF